MKKGKGVCELLIDIHTGEKGRPFSYVDITNSIGCIDMHDLTHLAYKR